MSPKKAIKEAERQSTQVETNSSCPADARILRIRNADTADAPTRVRVVVRALIISLNDWRFRQFQWVAHKSFSDVRRLRRT